MELKIIELDKFTAVGVSREINCENGNNHIEIPKMWDELNETGKSNEIANLNDGKVEGLLGICVGKTATEIDYCIATTGKRNSNFDNIEIPSSKWAVFAVDVPVLENIPSAWQYIFSEWFKNCGYEHGLAPDMEVYIHKDNHLICEIWISIL